MTGLLSLVQDARTTEEVSGFLKFISSSVWGKRYSINHISCSLLPSYQSLFWNLPYYLPQLLTLTLENFSLWSNITTDTDVKVSPVPILCLMKSHVSVFDLVLAWFKIQTLKTILLLQKLKWSVCHWESLILSVNGF